MRSTRQSCAGGFRILFSRGVRRQRVKMKDQLRAVKKEAPQPRLEGRPSRIVLAVQQEDCWQYGKIAEGYESCLVLCVSVIFVFLV